MYVSSEFENISDTLLSHLIYQVVGVSEIFYILAGGYGRAFLFIIFYIFLFIMSNLIKTLCTLMMIGVTLPLIAQQREALSQSLQEKVVAIAFSSDMSPKNYDENKGQFTGFSSTFLLKKGESGLPVYEIEVPRATKSQYGVSMHFRTTDRVRKGDVLLARITMRTLSARQESGESVVYYYFQEAQGAFDKSFITQIGTVENWKTFNIPFVAHKDMLAGEAQIGLAFGSLAQHLEVTGIEILNFGNSVRVEDLPETRFSYAGREVGAAWREEALRRIEEIRTSPLTVRVVDAEGKPVKGAKVEVSLQQSEFIWGTAVQESLLAKNDAESQAYKKHLKEFFNTAVIENGFKAGGWAWDGKHKMNTLLSFDWLRDNGFRQRGHNLVWPAWRFNSPLTKHIAMRDSASFDSYIKAQFYERMAYTKGQVVAWDVVNEYMHEKEFFRYLPYSAMVDWFKLAHELDPDAQLFINEYGMLNCVQSPQNIREYIDTIQTLRSKGAPIHAVGIQGHIGRQPRNPVQVITDLDLFIPTGLPVQITEFDINTPDEELQADYMRDFLIAVYSHPVVTGVTLWGFWENAHWRPDAGMFRKDWTPKGSALAWREWVVGKWKTHEWGKTDKKGILTVQGHLGQYTVSVEYRGQQRGKSCQLSKDTQVIEIRL